MSSQNKKKPTVSVVTITQIKRQNTIKLTAEHIDNQTYKNILEWVIVEGSKTLEEALENEQFIKTLVCKVPIVYVPAHKSGVFNGDHLGGLRNLGNDNSKGQILVVMDDDDYYPPKRVEHAVCMLKTSKAGIAGCSSKYLYDYDLSLLLKFKQYGPNHSTNDCFAYTREYLENNRYDPTKDMAEEASFTKHFTNQMIQLDPKYTIISSSHSYNTFNKKEICITGSILKTPGRPEDGYMYPMTESGVDQDLSKLMGDFEQRYNQIFVKGEQSEFDISYFCGGTSIEWDPTSKSLGGSEQAVVHLCTEWAKMGLTVAVYAKIKGTCGVNGVYYKDWKEFPFHKEHNTVVLWRMSGINCGLPFNIKTKRLWVDYHDNNFQFRHPYTPFVHKIDRIFFKSQFHLDEYSKVHQHNIKYAIIPNGIRLTEFENNTSPEIERERYRFCYCSCYSRGLVEILAFIWPIIFKNEPRAELHIYYGIDSIQDPQQRQQLTLLMGQGGVMDHGRQPVEVIAREKQKSTFHLYITDCIGEIDCISIRESLVAGCIPLLSNSGVFKNRDGLKFNLDRTPENYENIANGILNLMKKQEFLEICRQKFKKSPTICSWKTVAEEWLRVSTQE
jgi:glycosyltransferase involved in cell wall biosynthesis